MDRDDSQWQPHGQAPHNQRHVGNIGTASAEDIEDDNAVSWTLASEREAEPFLQNWAQVDRGHIRWDRGGCRQLHVGVKVEAKKT